MTMSKAGAILFLLTVPIHTAGADIFDDCRAKYHRCHGNCAPGNFSCDLLVKLCSEDFKKCLEQGASTPPLGGTGPTPAYEDPDPPRTPEWTPQIASGAKKRRRLGGRNEKT